jgi:hypothetical protein
VAVSRCLREANGQLRHSEVLRSGERTCRGPVVASLGKPVPCTWVIQRIPLPNIPHPPGDPGCDRAYRGNSGCLSPLSSSAELSATGSSRGLPTDHNPAQQRGWPQGETCAMSALLYLCPSTRLPVPGSGIVWWYQADCGLAGAGQAARSPRCKGDSPATICRPARYPSGPRPRLPGVGPSADLEHCHRDRELVIRLATEWPDDLGGDGPARRAATRGSSASPVNRALRPCTTPPEQRGCRLVP